MDFDAPTNKASFYSKKKKKISVRLDLEWFSAVRRADVAVLMG